VRRAGGVGGAAQGATARERELRRMRDGRGLHCPDHVRRVVVGALAVKPWKIDDEIRKIGFGTRSGRQIANNVSKQQIE
jgi:hypothetical protein